MAKADLHNHLGSQGKNPGFDETIDLAYNRLGNGGIFGIADSDDFRYENFVSQKGGRYERVPLLEESDKRMIYVPEKNITVVKCQEMFTKQGHVLAVAMPYRNNVTIKDTKGAIRAAKDLEASLVAVHPFYQFGIGQFLKGNPEWLQYFSSWEVFNGSAEFSFPLVLPRNANEKSLDFYIKENLSAFNIGMSAFTDGHSPEVIGKCYTELPVYNITSQQDLDYALRNVKHTNRLHTESNSTDSALHAFKMALVKLKLRKD